jgi:hypothetical protein
MVSQRKHFLSYFKPKSTTGSYPTRRKFVRVFKEKLYKTVLLLDISDTGRRKDHR